jgi:hypothetical protein
MEWGMVACASLIGTTKVTPSFRCQARRWYSRSHAPALTCCRNPGKNSGRWWWDAGDKNVSISSANIAQQCLRAGLLDKIQIDLVPILLGSGVRLFERLGAEPIEMECTTVLEAPGVTHLIYRIVK